MTDGELLAFTIVEGVVALFFLLCFVGMFFGTRVERKEDERMERVKKRWRLQEQAAEYDRLRDEEFRELGWTGKY